MFFSFSNFNTSGKVFDIQFGYIEKTTLGPLGVFHQQEIKAGRAMYLDKAYKKLRKALESDDYLMAECIKLAISRGYIVKKNKKDERDYIPV